MKNEFKSVDEYLLIFPEEIQSLLVRVRSVIRKKAPEAVEGISYGMPSYKTYGKPLVYFAGFKNHIGFYATPTGHSEFKRELAKYKQGKGSVQFSLKEPVPFDLIGQIVEFRVYENRIKYMKK